LWVADADLGGVGVDEAPVDGAREHLPERLRRLEAVAGGDRHPPCRDLLRAQVGDKDVAEGGDRLA
jgi:hypothetical protein